MWFMVPATYRPLLWDSGCAVAKSAEKFSKLASPKNVSLLQLWLLKILRNMSNTTVLAKFLEIYLSQTFPETLAMPT
jgi:hypothetical protein